MTKRWILLAMAAVASGAVVYSFAMPRGTPSFPALAAVIAQAEQPRIVKVIEGNYVWPVAPAAPPIKLIGRTTTLKIRAVGLKKEDLLFIQPREHPEKEAKVSLPPGEESKPGVPAEGEATLDWAKWEDLAKYHLDLIRKKKDPPEEKELLDTVQISRPLPSAKAPIIGEFSRKDYMDDFAKYTGQSSIGLLGPYIGLRVGNISVEPQVEIFKREDNKYVALFVTLEKGTQWRKLADKSFEGQIYLPQELAVVGAQYQLRLRVPVDETRHIYAAEEISFTIRPPTELPVPTFAEQPVEKGGIFPTPDARGVYYLNQRRFKIHGKILKGTIRRPDDAEVLLFRNEQPYKPISITYPPAPADTWSAEVEVPAVGLHTFEAQLALDGLRSEKSVALHVLIQTEGPVVTNVHPVYLAGEPAITVSFKGAPLVKETFVIDSDNAFSIVKIEDSTVIKFDARTAAYDPSSNTVSLQVGQLTPGRYQLRIKPTLRDVFGNPLGKREGKPTGEEQVFDLVKPVGAELPLVRPGISHVTGPYITFPEFTEPRKKPDGFNPGDHVETRVARLYYFRDAHRVAQIINRKAKSYNRVAVDTRRRLAEEARTAADQYTRNRQIQERNAVQQATEARQAEQALAQAQAFLANADARRNAAADALAQAPDDKAKERAKEDKRVAEEDLQQARKRVETAMFLVQATRTSEVQAKEAWLTAQGDEERARANQFRLEVAALHEDPDTYAPGLPDSKDPVEQVSISVIGESEIQLRGPISGINIIREMINQIDAPAGQVRVAIHTVQVNGERGDRMEKVVGKIQDYIDHSRFLTQQSALMLRKAVAKVASRNAYEASMMCPGDTQESRDLRYLYSFFGKDFVDELKAQDSEFLRSGNKLLSLHSMDTTSLASSLFILGLAKNGTRMEILREFEALLQGELPPAEMSFLEAGGFRRGMRKFQLMAGNARFQSFIGFFNADVLGDDTITPLQREFIRLAQIFKSRLITELEVKQRVMERALIEERLGDYLAELAKAKEQEEKAHKALKDVQEDIGNQRQEVVFVITQISAVIRGLSSQIDALSEKDKEFRSEKESGKREIRLGKKRFSISVHERTVKGLEGRETEWTNAVEQFLETLKEGFSKISINPAIDQVKYKRLVDAYNQAKKEIQELEAAKRTSDKYLLEVLNVFKVHRFVIHVALLMKELKRPLDQIDEEGRSLLLFIGRPDAELSDIYGRWYRFYSLIKEAVNLLEEKDVVRELIVAADKAAEKFNDLPKSAIRLQLARQAAINSRRPLDHKKLLDMLIDEIQDKYVELLEGTRAHTANIDDYIKRVATALEDDFNTQFYLPAFREVRQASRFWDVTLAAIETTSILTNNRTYAKVEPQATMEFDLPRRDILITEAMQGAKALVDTYGALVQDASFLALVKMRSGQPTSSPAPGTTGGAPGVRSVLPSLSRQTDERLLSQASPGGKTFGTPLDALIPDPAIYKFETGTGYEIRPVIQPDGQSVVFHFHYMYTTRIQEPVRADEKHLGRVKRHFIDTDVQLGNYELREISRYQVALKAARTARGVPLFEDIPGVGILFRPLPSTESSLQQNIVLGQSVIYPTLFDLMGLRWAPAVADLDPLGLTNADFIVRGRKRYLMNRVFDFSSSKVDEALRIPESERRGDLYRTQETIPYVHPNGYQGPGMNLRDSHLREGYDPRSVHPETRFVPGQSGEGRMNPYGDVENRLRERVSDPRYFAPGLPPGLPPGLAPGLPPGGVPHPHMPYAVPGGPALPPPTQGPTLPMPTPLPPQGMSNLSNMPAPGLAPGLSAPPGNGPSNGLSPQVPVQPYVPPFRAPPPVYWTPPSAPPFPGTSSPQPPLLPGTPFCPNCPQPLLPSSVPNAIPGPRLNDRVPAGPPMSNPAMPMSRTQTTPGPWLVRTGQP